MMARFRIRRSRSSFRKRSWWLRSGRAWLLMMFALLLIAAIVLLLSRHNEAFALQGPQDNADSAFISGLPPAGSTSPAGLPTGVARAFS